MSSPKSSPSTYTLVEAAAICGYRRANSMRELHLATAEQRAALGHAYDDYGRVVLRAAAVDKLARQLHRERVARGNWRPRNLGAFAQKGRPSLRKRSPHHKPSSPSSANPSDD